MVAIYDAAFGNVNAAGDVQGQIAQGGMPAQSMNAYINPYQQQVIGNTVGRMNDSYLQNNMRAGDAASAASAFGGSRHGVVEAQVTDDYMRNMSETVTGMNQQGFNTAANMGFQDVSQQLQASGMQGNTGLNQFNMGNTVAAQQMANGNQQQNMSQMLLDLANGDVNSYLNSPNNSISNMLQALSGSPLNNNMTSTTSTTPGTMDWLGLGLQSIGKFGGGGK